MYKKILTVTTLVLPLMGLSTSSSDDTVTDLSLQSSAATANHSTNSAQYVLKDGIHTATSADNDYTIARKYGMRLKNLHDLNTNINWNKLKPGTTVKIQIKESVSSTESAENNGVEQSVVKVAYKVQKGDSDWLLSRKYKFILADLYALNPDVNWDKLTEGTIINLPVNPATAQNNASDIKPINVANIATIIHDDVVVRSTPGGKGVKLTLLSKGSKFSILSLENGWYKLKLSHESVGWVRGDMIRTDLGISSESTTVPNSNKAGKDVKPVGSAKKIESKSHLTKTDSEKLVSNAKDYLGVKYRWAGTSRRGIDCSGYTAAIFAKNGINLPHCSRAQFTMGKRIEKKNLVKGDLVFFGKKGRVNHVGIYIGNGKFIHASSGRGSVGINNLSDSYYLRTYMGARRVK